MSNPEPSKELQLVLESLVINQLSLICELSQEGFELIERVRSRMAIKAIQLNAQITPTDVMNFLLEKYKDGPENPGQL